MFVVMVSDFYPLFQLTFLYEFLHTDIICCYFVSYGLSVRIEMTGVK